MDRMVRKQVYIEPRQEVLLKRRARELGVSEAELIRRAIDQAVSRSFALAPEHELWEEIEEYIKKHRMFDVPQTGRSWTRDELYEERFRRYSS